MAQTYEENTSEIKRLEWRAHRLHSIKISEQSRLRYANQKEFVESPTALLISSYRQFDITFSSTASASYKTEGNASHAALLRLVQRLKQNEDSYCVDCIRRRARHR